jgi:predicted PurR-regulated permease PerM
MWLSLRIFLSREEFDEAVVVIPCIAAAIISIVPIMPSFFVAIPHALGLWLNVNQSGESISAIESTAGLLDALLFFGLHFYVYYEISPRIYGSMHAGTPNFLVSMSVVGGIVYIGLSGAVVGPLILTGFVTTLELLRMHTRQGCSQPSA